MNDMNDEEKNILKNFYHSYHYIILIMSLMLTKKNIYQQRGFRPNAERGMTS